MFRSLGNGTFEELAAEAGPAILDAHPSRGCAFGDFDNDGDVDILVVNLNEHRLAVGRTHDAVCEIECVAQETGHRVLSCPVIEKIDGRGTGVVYGA